MSYCLYKLKFSTPLHVGDSRLARSVETSSLNICADTLFSALCNNAIDFEGNNGINRLYNMVKKGKIKFSDTMPYKNEDLYIPKPYLQSKSDKLFDISKQKILKKLCYIPISMINKFCGSIKGTDNFDIENIDNNFCINQMTSKVALNDTEKTELYSIASIHFLDSCGLYGIIKYENKEDVEYVLKLLSLTGLSGIGGKISSGYGKYEVSKISYFDQTSEPQIKLFEKMLDDEHSKSYISITVNLPIETELEQALDGAKYNIIRRGGFAYSVETETPLKKQTQYCFSAGSVFKKRFIGDIYDVSRGHNHPIYRYLMPLFLGVDL